MATYKLQRYLLVTLDPVHIGTGGYRLGRVDNSIVREPGTRIPKIPGSAIHGAIRSYAAQLYETPEAAGQKQDEVQNPDRNPICYTFGYIKAVRENDEEKTHAFSGVVNIFDAHILLFPVYSMAGPVWVSTLGRLKNAGFSVENDNNKKTSEPEYGKAYLTQECGSPLNLGWLMVEIAGQVTVSPPEGTNWQNEERWKAVAERIVLVNEALFSHIVNSNLEVRTSVSINPETGAAEEKALFTYESIPRATFLTMEVVLDDYREKFPSKENLEKWKSEVEEKLSKNRLKKDEKEKACLEREKENIQRAIDHVENLNSNNAKNWGSPLDVVTAGLRMTEWLGVGGMGTRGFGRMAVVGEPIENSPCDDAVSQRGGGQ